MKTFNDTTQNKLEILFQYLPEIFFWTVIITRAFIALPLFIAAKVHFAFLQFPILIIISSLVSVAIVESILTLPSLSTAFFKHFGLKRYQRVAFVTTILLGIFNQSLIVLAWSDTGMSKEAFYIYSVLNLASIILAEMIGFMTAKPQEPVSSNIQSQVEIKERSITGAPNDIASILMLDLSDSEKMLKLNQAGLTQRKIAEVLGTNPTRVNVELRRLKNELEQKD